MRAAFGLLCLVLTAWGQLVGNDPFPPYRIAGNLYYVGTDDIACFLVTSRRGHALINTGYETTPALIASSVAQLGFKVTDIKYLLNSQAHYDHIAGQFVMQDMTDGAEVWASEGDSAVIEGGGKGDFHWEGLVAYPPVRVSHRFKDGEVLKIGDTELAAHLTPGHSKGCTTWTMQVKEGGKTYDVVIVGGTTINEGVKLAGNAKYPQIALDYLRTFRVLKALQCDIFLGAHGKYYGMKEKYERMKKGEREAWVDPKGYAEFVERSEKIFLEQWKREGGK